MNIEIKTELFVYQISGNGKNIGMIDRASGQNIAQADTSVARIKKSGIEYSVSSIRWDGNKLRMSFPNGINAELSVIIKPKYLIIEVLDLSDPSIEEFTFLDIPLTVNGAAGEQVAGCLLALNLQTNVPELPGPMRCLKAIACARFGFKKAKAALIACPFDDLRGIIQEVVDAEPDLPHSAIGGPRALDAAINRGSYFLGNMPEDQVDQWIDFIKAFGFNQLDFTGGKAFRFGDCRLDPEIYPNGRKTLKAMIAKYHAAGIKVGLHTYSFFMDKACPWVTPVPDPRLAKDAVFTLDAALNTTESNVTVAEPTVGMSAITGFFVRNSVTLQIDDELIAYRAVSQNTPYVFSECERGACGTKTMPHAKGAKVHHLRECFGLFVPDGDSSLLAEVAGATADFFNECGFDMIYLDALDGEDVIAGGKYGWHYGSKYVFELVRRLQKPALMEMSTFHHHLWFVRSRHGAWDHPARNHKRFIDLHVLSNDQSRKIFLPTNLGWWTISTWMGVQGEPSFKDDIEYLCCKCLGTDSGLSLSGVDQKKIADNENLQRLADLIKRYENLRQANALSDSIKSKLKAPGREFTLITGADGNPGFRQVECFSHKIEALDGPSHWQIKNIFREQPVRLRIETLMSVAPYADPDNILLAGIDSPDEFYTPVSDQGVAGKLEISSEKSPVSQNSLRYTAWRTDRLAAGAKADEMPHPFEYIKLNRKAPRGWSMTGKTFKPPLDLGPDINSGGEPQGIGVWICGDGRSELLNFQIRSVESISNAIGDHYATVNFTGWRYFELIEHEGKRINEYIWPYSHRFYSIYGWVYHHKVEQLNIWFNNLPAKGEVSCLISPVKALKLVKNNLIKPSISIGENTLLFPVEMETGSYIEFESEKDCKLYAPDGKLIALIHPEGRVPCLKSGLNDIALNSGSSPGIKARARVTVIAHGEEIR